MIISSRFIEADLENADFRFAKGLGGRQVPGAQFPFHLPTGVCGLLLLIQTFLFLLVMLVTKNFRLYSCGVSVQPKAAENFSIRLKRLSDVFAGSNWGLTQLPR